MFIYCETSCEESDGAISLGLPLNRRTNRVSTVADFEMHDRKQSERDFHNRRELTRVTDEGSHDAFYTNRRFYRITETSHRFLTDWMERRRRNASVLDYCCGTGEIARRAARMGGDVTGIDISDVSIESAHRAAAEEGIGSRIKFMVGDAENTGLPSASFDVILATGVLHHLDLDAAYREMARLLKPGGVAICVEAMAHNPVITWYRRSTPHLRTPFEIDHILSVHDIRRAKRHFNAVQARFFHLADLGAIPFIGTPLFRPVLTITNALDAVLTRVPFVRRYSWQCIFTLSEPKRV